jgi:hypothetical protein
MVAADHRTERKLNCYSADPRTEGEDEVEKSSATRMEGRPRKQPSPEEAATAP